MGKRIREKRAIGKLNPFVVKLHNHLSILVVGLTLSLVSSLGFAWFDSSLGHDRSDPAAFSPRTILVASDQRSKKCRVVTPTLCPQGYHAVVGRNRRGCETRSKCIANSPNCPTIHAILCPPSYHTVGTVDDNGCETQPKCVSNQRQEPR